MKINKTISLDEEIIKMLADEKNASLLINSYLRQYFGLTSPFTIKDGVKETIPEEINKELEEAFK